MFSETEKVDENSNECHCINDLIYKIISYLAKLKAYMM